MSGGLQSLSDPSVPLLMDVQWLLTSSCHIIFEFRKEGSFPSEALLVYTEKILPVSGRTQAERGAGIVSHLAGH